MHARARLLVLLGLLGAWWLRWTTALTDVGAEIQHGPERTGAVAALCLIVLWGLSATASVARRRPAAALGVALTDVVVALGAALFLVFEHPWFPGGGARASWIPVFGPLALLALLHAVLLVRSSGAAREVEVIRGCASVLVACALAIGNAWWPAGIAFWIGLAPLLVGRLRNWRAALEGLLLVAAVVALLAPDLHGALLHGSESDGVYLGHFAWIVLCVVLILLAAAGLWRAIADRADSQSAA